MGKIELTVQGSRTLIFCRSAGIEGAGQFIGESFGAVRAVLRGSAGVPFLAFQSLTPDTLAARAETYLEAGYAVQAVPERPGDLQSAVLPSGRVLSLTVTEKPESRSALYAEFSAYAKVFGLPLKNCVYEYYFAPADGAEQITAFVVPLCEAGQ